MIKDVNLMLYCQKDQRIFFIILLLCVAYGTCLIDTIFNLFAMIKHEVNIHKFISNDLILIYL